MGKNSKKVRSAETESGMSRHLRREVLEICNTILEKCKVQFKNEWEEFVELYRLLEKLQKKQHAFTLKHHGRREHMTDFLKWLQKNGVDCSSVEVTDFGAEGLGLKAAKDIKEAEVFLSIPRKLMMTSSDALKSPLGALVKEDCILKVMPNIVLSLLLLCECQQLHKSLWAPYLRVLPPSYTTPLYATLEELSMLKGSPSLSEVINQFRNVARQYAYFFKLFQGLSSTNNLPIKLFCYDDYRWAVSTVMTRQNKLPVLVAPGADPCGCCEGHGGNKFEGGQQEVGLIPFWDMCNHSSGHITTDYDVEKAASDCHAMRDTKLGEQIYIFYGPRSNSEFLVHNGFVPATNPHDCIPLKLGVSKNDSLYGVKAEVMARCKISTNNTFYLSCYSAQPIEPDMLVFLRLFHMPLHELMGLMGGLGVEGRRARLRVVQEPQLATVDVKLWSYLQTRCLLLLQLYASTLQEDEVLLKSPVQGGLSELGRSMLMLRASEKRILHAVVAYCEVQKAAVLKMLEEASVENLEVEIGPEVKGEEENGLPKTSEGVSGVVEMNEEGDNKAEVTMQMEGQK